MRCAACGYMTEVVNPLDPGGSPKKNEPFIPVVISVEERTTDAYVLARSMPTLNLVACPRCKTVRLSE